MAKLTFINQTTGQLIEVDTEELKDKRRQILRANIVNEAIRTNLRYFMTLTLNPRLVPFHVCDVCLLHHIWDKFLKRLKRQVDNRISYITIAEPHRNGRMHLHVLLSAVPERTSLIGEAWRACSGALITHLTTAPISDIHKLALYASKHLCSSKAKGKLVTSSRDVQLSKPTPIETDWIVEERVSPEIPEDSQTCSHGFPVGPTHQYFAYLEETCAALQNLQLSFFPDTKPREKICPALQSNRERNDRRRNDKLDRDPRKKAQRRSPPTKKHIKHAKKCRKPAKMSEKPAKNGKYGPPGSV